MEKIKRIIASFVLGILSLPYTLMAQDEGTYIENLGVQDSSYMEEGNPIPAGTTSTTAEQASGSGTTAVIIVVAVVVVVAVVLFLLRNKKKK
jgi:hypothetical protein